MNRFEDKFDKKSLLALSHLNKGLNVSVEEAEEFGNNLIINGIATSYDIFLEPWDIIFRAMVDPSYRLLNSNGERVDLTEKMKDGGYLALSVKNVVSCVIQSMYARRLFYNGRQIGYNDGQDNGSKVGEKRGYKKGYEEGLKEGRKIGKPFDREKIKKGEEVRIKKADDHAKKMFEVFQNSSEISQAKSIRSIVKILDEQKIITANGGKWGVETVRGLYRRWEKLGLVETKEPE